MKKHASISHLTGKEQYSLHCIKNKIVGLLQPLIIFCWGSSITNSIQRSCFTPSKRKTEESNFACGLLVVLPNGIITGDNTTREIEELTEPVGKVNAIIHSLDSVLQHLKEGNLFFSWVRRSAIVLYEKTNTTQLLPPPINKRQEHEQQVERFYLEDPNMTNYLEERLLPVTPTVKKNKEEAKPQQIEVRLLFDIKDGRLHPNTQTPG